jgi:hypothetical protein
MSSATLVMQTDADYCTYTQVKVDDQLTERIRAAAAHLSMASGERVSVQEFVSDLLNDQTARILKLKPITRRPPPRPPHGKPRKARKP